MGLGIYFMVRKLMECRMAHPHTPLLWAGPYLRKPHFIYGGVEGFSELRLGSVLRSSGGPEPYRGGPTNSESYFSFSSAKISFICATVLLWRALRFTFTQLPGGNSPNLVERLSEKGRRSLHSSITDHPKALFAFRISAISTLLALLVHLFGQSQKVNSPKFV